MDTSSEEYRHLCEARTALAMPLLKRKAHLTAVETRRGMDERRRLEGTMMRIWVDRQVDALVALTRDADRVALLLRIENATNLRTRANVERAYESRVSANDNNEKTERAA